MIRVTMEVLPGGVDLGKHNVHLGTLLIDNILGRSMETEGQRGDYRARVFKKRRRCVGIVYVSDYPRRAYHPWELVRRILNEARAEKVL